MRELARKFCEGCSLIFRSANYTDNSEPRYAIGRNFLCKKKGAVPMRPILSIGLIALLLSTAGCANPATKVIDKLTNDEPATSQQTTESAPAPAQTQGQATAQQQNAAPAAQQAQPAAPASACTTAISSR